MSLRSIPSIVILPSMFLSEMNFIISFAIVDLPHPLGPLNPIISPFFTSKLRLSTTVLSAYRYVKLSTLSSLKSTTTPLFSASSGVFISSKNLFPLAIV